jgi:hypothetical protein
MPFVLFALWWDFYTFFAEAMCYSTLFHWYFSALKYFRVVLLLRECEWSLTGELMIFLLQDL